MDVQRSHHDYDMNKSFTPEQSRSQIWTILTSANLGKYMDNIIGAKIDFLAFGYLSRSDMRHLGIINHDDQDRLLEVLKPLQTMYRELDSYEVNWGSVANNVEETSRTLAGALTMMNLFVKQHPIMHRSLVDIDTPSSQAAIRLLDLIESRLDFIDQDIRYIIEKVEADGDQVKRRFSRKSAVACCSLLAFAAVSAACYFKPPFLRKV